MANLSNYSNDFSLWLYPALHSPFGARYAFYFLLTAAIFILMLRAILRLRTASPAPATAHASKRRVPGDWMLFDQSGTVTIEFALAFPILLITALFLLQIMQLMVGNIFIHYASFVAARSAIVQIPTNRVDEDGEFTNLYNESPEGAKNNAIRAAAVWALVPVSGRFASGSTNTTSFTQGLSDYFTMMQADKPGWINAQMPDRLRYADACTTIDLSVTTVDGNMLTVTPVAQAVQDIKGVTILPGEYLFGPKQPITVNVHHKLVLSVPGVGAFFASGRHNEGSGGAVKDNSSSFYSLVTASCTLVNEGYSTAMPQPPTLPRNP